MPSYLSYRRSLSVLDQDDNIESWITVNGNHIPIMKGQTKAEAVRSFVESRRKESKKDDGIIRYGDENYGKAGRYEVFRSGKTNAPNGTIFTSSTFVGANTYADTQPDRETVERYNVNLKNPLVIEGSSDVDNLRKTYKALFGKEINPDKPLDQTSWIKYDEMIMRKLKKTKYDSIITKVNGNPKEIQLPDWTPMIQTGSYKRYNNDYENEEYKAAAKEDSENAKRYWDFVNNEYRRDNEEDRKKELELRGIMNNSYAGAVAFLKADDYYRKESSYEYLNAFHGTNADDFEKFNLRNAGKTHGGQYGLGFYFTTNKEEASGFGKNVGEYRIKNKKMVNPENYSDITAEQINEIGKRFSDKYVKEPYGKQGINDITKELNSTPYGRSYNDVIENYLLDMGTYGDSDENMDISDYRQKVYEILGEVTGINGYKIPRENNQFWYAMFNPDDIEKVG